MGFVRRAWPVLFVCLCALGAHAGNTVDAEIDALIARVAQARDVVFIRNGSEHTAAEAAAHLQRKRAAAGAHFASAEQFIDRIGTRSSITGIAYRVRTPDGQEVDSAVWLHRLLRDVRAARLTPLPPAAAGAKSPVPATR